MTILYSTGIRDFVATYGSYKRALQGGVMKIYSGAAPATADAAITGTLLVTISLASGAWTAETPAAGSATLAGTAGTVTGITVAGNEILGSTCAFVDTLSNLATLVAATINQYIPKAGAMFKASTSSAKVIITAINGTGNITGAVVTTGAGGITSTDVNVGTEVAGVNSANGLLYTWTSAGTLSKNGTFSGVPVATGNATHFRLCGSFADADGLSTTLNRVQGTCGTSGADYIMSSTLITTGEAVTVNPCSLVVPANN